MDKKQDHPKKNRRSSQDRFSTLIGTKERRKVQARQTFRNTWFGFSAFGLIGWAVAIPTLAGIALGVWLDARHPGRYSWTLMLLVAGLGIGCLNAWHWISREHQTIRREQEKNNHDD
jgi:ATP synthase protein I